MMNDFFPSKLSTEMLFHDEAVNSKSFHVAVFPNLEMRITPRKKNGFTNDFWDICQSPYSLLLFIGEWMPFAYYLEWLKIFTFLVFSVVLLAQSKGQMQATTSTKRTPFPGWLPATIRSPYRMQRPSFVKLTAVFFAVLFMAVTQPKAIFKGACVHV